MHMNRPNSLLIDFPVWKGILGVTDAGVELERRGEGRSLTLAAREWGDNRLRKKDPVSG